MGVGEFFDQKYTYAVVGASANPEKYGYIVFRDLCAAGFKVVPVNPKLSTLLEKQAKHSLTEITPPPDVAVFVVPPSVGVLLLEDVAKAGIKKVWFQPGAESEAIRQRAKELGLSAMADGSCIMVVRRQYGFSESDHQCRA